MAEKQMQKVESKVSPVPNLDKTDISILKLLQKNARMTVKEIAATIHLSTTPVHERIKET